MIITLKPSRLLDQAEHALLNLIKAGDLTAFEQLFNRHHLVLSIYARKVTGDPIEAQDIVQNIFVKLYTNRETITINTSIKSYLYRSVHNACLNHIRQDKLHQGHREHIRRQMPLADHEDTMVAAELEEKVWSAIQILPEQCRRIFILNRFEAKKNSEIAELLGISVRTVETQISKALKTLREKLPETLVAFLLISHIA